MCGKAANWRGVFVFNNVADLLAGKYFQYRQFGGLGGLTADQAGTVSFGQKEYAGFVQDQWFLSPKLTMTLGVRYEYLDNPKYWPILEAAEALDRCLYIHPRAPSDGMKGPLGDYRDPAWGSPPDPGRIVPGLVVASSTASADLRVGAWRVTLTPAVNIETISFARDIRPSEKRSASKRETGSRMMKTCGTWVI